ncbi:MAG: hypothetical protein Q7W16_02460 [Coriobacteriia bacterium]|nr:hypothetical protein [Coriobacteriia bacterium]
MGGSVATGDHRDDDLCHDCGGLCCCLYLAHDENGEYIGEDWLPAYIDLWLDRLRESGALTATASQYGAGVAGVEPLHDPRMSHLPTSEGAAYRATLPDWVDVRKCQFCHPETGCLLPRGYRAPICGEYRCELWEPHGCASGVPSDD